MKARKLMYFFLRYVATISRALTSFASVTGANRTLKPESSLLLNQSQYSFPIVPRDRCQDTVPAILRCVSAASFHLSSAYPLYRCFTTLSRYYRARACLPPNLPPLTQVRPKKNGHHQGHHLATAHHSSNSKSVTFVALIKTYLQSLWSKREPTSASTTGGMCTVQIGADLKPPQTLCRAQAVSYSHIGKFRRRVGAGLRMPAV
ncbi:hypothetical protein C8R43DRAFT_589776 [Mycena crocata]|nr:hypothetical protein C8R43DRAFT_589776 [Mycena crocata]